MWIICFWPVRLAHLLVVAPMQYKEILKGRQEQVYDVYCQFEVH